MSSACFFWPNCIPHFSPGIPWSLSSRIFLRLSLQIQTPWFLAGTRSVVYRAYICHGLFLRVCVFLYLRVWSHSNFSHGSDNSDSDDDYDHEPAVKPFTSAPTSIASAPTSIASAPTSIASASTSISNPSAVPRVKLSNARALLSRTSEQPAAGNPKAGSQSSGPLSLFQKLKEQDYAHATEVKPPDASPAKLMCPPQVHPGTNTEYASDPSREQHPAITEPELTPDITSLNQVHTDVSACNSSLLPVAFDSRYV